MKVAVIGTGYVGLVSGTCFSDLGNSVICVDNNADKVATLQSNEVPFYEPGLDACMKRNSEADRLTFTTSTKEAVIDSEVVFIAVGTPPKENGTADLSAVFSVAEDIIDTVKTESNPPVRVLVTKSTVPVGTGRQIMALIEKAGLSDLLLVASNPEFLREGSAMNDFFRPDRVVIGSDSDEALDKVANLYAPLYRNKTPIIKTTLETSELSKYASNAFLATKISFINEMACLCDDMGADVRDIANIMGMDGRIGKYFLHPGPGYGGSCFPKDTQALIQTSAKLGYDLKIVKAAENVNKLQKNIAFNKTQELLGDLSGKTIGVLGLAFKPNTDDIRDSSSIELINALLKAKASVRLYDPEALEQGKRVWGDKIEYCKNSYDVSEGADALVLMTEWNAFRELDLERMKQLMTGNVFIDMRNVYEHADFQRVGFNYYLIGRPA
jgi:UDPglucose 6-dehydrogenase